MGLIEVLASRGEHGDTRRMTHDRSETVSQFLTSRRALTEAGDTEGAERLDETLKDIAVANPDSALAIIQQLSSGDFAAKEAAAIYVQYLFPTHREQVTDLLLSLLNDPNPDIARQALQTIDTLTQDPQLTATQAAHRLTEIRTQN
jgi:predicted TPR repeat methyltransferase